MYKDSRINRIDRTGKLALSVLEGYKNGEINYKQGSIQLLAEIAVNTSIIIDMLDIVFSADPTENPIDI